MDLNEMLRNEGYWSDVQARVDFLREVQAAMLNSAELVEVGMRAYPMEELDRAVYGRMITNLRRLAGERKVE